MKKIFALLLITLPLFISCDDDDDVDFDTVGTTYEIENVDFNAPDFATRFFFPQNIVQSDVVLVYRLEDIVNGLDVWEPLPTATIFLNDPDDTSVLYRYNFTEGDVDILLESNNPDLVPADLTQNQIFRIVVVPSNFAQNRSLQNMDMNSLLKLLNVSPQNITKISM